MDGLIENLNQQGEHFLRFAWPMFWQSSLLIVVVLAVDLLAAAKLRPVVRHALWGVVLVKLLLPPSLALPSGPAWWMASAQPPYVSQAPTVAQGKFVAISQESISRPIFLPTVQWAPPAPKLSPAGWILLGMGGVAAGLLLWMLVRWGQIFWLVRRAEATEKFAGLMLEVQQLAGRSGMVRLRLVNERMSPAVCGLFRPIILLPRPLAENLATAELRAVLLHEILHIQRLDIWVNCVQSLLQLAYWWHPLVWLANGRMRRAREEAVDDAVMVALGNGAGIYPSTLLEVARLAFRRPLLSLGLVGILETRSPLRQRVERLVAFRGPRKAGLTLVSVCGICVFSAVLVPMGKGPAPARTNSLADVPAPSQGVTAASSSTPTNLPAILMSGEIYTLPADEVKKFVAGWSYHPGSAGDWWTAPRTEWLRVQGAWKVSAKLAWPASCIEIPAGKPAHFTVANDRARPMLGGMVTAVGGRVELYAEEEISDWAADAALTNRFNIHATVPLEDAMMIRLRDGAGDVVVCLSFGVVTNDAAFRAVPYGEMRDKLAQIRLPEIAYDPLPLEKVLSRLREEAIRRDPEHKGINYLIYNDSGAVDPLPTGARRDESSEVGSVLIRMPPLTNVSLKEALDTVVRAADRPIQYSIHAYGVSFSAKPTAGAPLQQKIYRVEPGTFSVPPGKDRTGSDPAAEARATGRIKELFEMNGVDWKSPAGKTIFYDDRSGYLLVTATEKDLDTIGGVLKSVRPMPAQVDLKSRLVEVPQDDTDLGIDWYLGSFWAPQIMILSGRQTQMRATQDHHYIGDFPPYHNGYPENGVEGAEATP